MLCSFFQHLRVLPFLVLFAVFAFVSSPPRAAAQAFPCIDSLNQPCDVPWQYDSLSVQMPSCGVGCELTVRYAYRICYANDQIQRSQDINILQIAMDSICYATCDLQTIQANALEAVLKKNDMKFRPLQQGCDEQTRLMSAQCLRGYWEHIYDFAGNFIRSRARFEVCNVGGCCHQKLRICRSGNSISITSIGSGFIAYMPGVCDTTVYYNQQLPLDSACHQNCNWVRHTRFTVPQPKLGNAENEQPAPLPEVELSGSLEVYDLNGSLRLRQNVHKESLNTILQRLQKSATLPVGVYAYVIRQEENTLRGSVVIVR